jgi:hypothetical protein
VWSHNSSSRLWWLHESIHWRQKEAWVWSHNGWWIGCPCMSTIVQAECPIVPIGRLSFRATTDCKL